MADCCIIGGGVIGLSLARELARRGAAVEVLCRDPLDRTASWAAAGIFPPVVGGDGGTGVERFTAWSDRLHWEWALELADETGIDNGLRRCGGLHVAGSAAGRTRLAGALERWQGQGVRSIPCDGPEIAAAEPALAGAVADGTIATGVVLPDEAQIRTSRHLDALFAACRSRGVTITHATVHGLDITGDRVTGVRTESGTIHADRYCLAAGAWSGGLAKELGLELRTRPIRGQIVLLRLPQQVLTRIVSFGLDYLVPRPDGRLLVGATIEDVGFDPVTTAEAEADLLGVARRLLGDLPPHLVERTWAGLRPGSVDGLPTLGRGPRCHNAWVAAGHFRAGIHQSTGSAVLVADMMLGQRSPGRPPIDDGEFAPARPPATRRANGESVGAYLARVAESAAAPP
jgi:glycine oxidase